jgi:hypothetical protein
LQLHSHGIETAATLGAILSFSIASLNLSQGIMKYIETAKVLESLGSSLSTINTTALPHQQFLQASSATNLPHKPPVYQSTIANMVSFTYASYTVLAAVAMLQGVQGSAVGTAVKGVLGAVGLKVKARGDTSLWERGM